MCNLTNEHSTVREIAVLLGLMCLYACEDCTLFAFSEAMDLLSITVQPGTILKNMETVFSQVGAAEGRKCSRCHCARDAQNSWSSVCSCASCQEGCLLQVQSSLQIFKKSYLLDVGEHTESAWFPAVFP